MTLSRAHPPLCFVLAAGLAACGDDGGGTAGGIDAGATVDAGSGGEAPDGSPGGGIDSGPSGGGELTASGDTCEGQDFSACGGELVGTWSPSGGCVTPQELPYYPACGAAIEVAVEGFGELTLGGDGTYTQSGPFFFDAELDATVPKSCLDDGETCTENPVDDEGVDMGDSCLLNYGHDLLISEDGTWTADSGAGTIELTGSGGALEGTFEYCVEGSTVTLRRTNADYHEGRITLTRP